MPATRTVSPRVRALRGRMAQALPRVPVSTLARRAGYSRGHVSHVLNGHADEADSIDKLEAAMDAIEAEREPVTQ